MEGPPLGAGLIRDAAAHRALFLRDPLDASDYPRAIAAVDALFHTKPPQSHDEALKDVQPRDGYWPRAVLGTRWTVGDTQRTVKNVPYRLLRLCRAGSADGYPTAEEKEAASARKDRVIEEQDATIGKQDAALQALRGWLEARAIDPEAILRARKTDA